MYFIAQSIIYTVNFYICLRLIQFTLSQVSGNQGIDRNRIYKFYFCYYIFFYIGYQIYSRMIFTKEYFLIYISVMWVPQIIHNYVSNNYTSLPSFYVFTYSFNKLVFTVRFIMIKIIN